MDISGSIYGSGWVNTNPTVVLTEPLLAVNSPLVDDASTTTETGATPATIVTISLAAKSQQLTDGIALLKTTDNALELISGKLQQIRDLAIKSQSTADLRTAIQPLSNDILNIIKNTSDVASGKKVLNGDLSSSGVSYAISDTYIFGMGAVGADASGNVGIKVPDMKISMAPIIGYNMSWVQSTDIKIFSDIQQKTTLIIPQNTTLINAGKTVNDKNTALTVATIAKTSATGNNVSIAQTNYNNALTNYNNAVKDLGTAINTEYDKAMTPYAGLSDTNAIKAVAAFEISKAVIGAVFVNSSTKTATQNASDKLSFINNDSLVVTKLNTLNTLISVDAVSVITNVDTLKSQLIDPLRVNLQAAIVHLNDTNSKP